MRKLVKPLGALALLALALAALACREAEEAQPPATIVPPGSVLETLEKLALSEQDVPAGFRISGIGRDENEQFAMFSYAYGNSQSIQEQTPGAIYDLQSTVLRFNSVADAEAFIATMKRKAPEPYSETKDPELLFDVRGMTPMDIAIQGADDVFAAHDIVVREEANVKKPTSRTFIAIRRGQFVSLVILAAVENHPDDAEVLALAEKAALRLQTETVSG